MAVSKRIVITDLTRMSGFDLCIAGYATDESFAPLRPLLSRGVRFPTLHPDETWCRSLRNGPGALFSVLKLDAHDHRPDPPHTEDWAIAPGSATVEAVLPVEDRRALLTRLQQPCVDGLFGEPVNWSVREDGLRTAGYVAPGRGLASLGTVNAAIERFLLQRNHCGTIDYRAMFSDEAGNRTRLSITDLTFRLWADHLRVRQGLSFDQLNRQLNATFADGREVWVRIGLTRPWSRSDNGERGCYLQITGIHTVPDYLEGATWTELQRASF